MTTLARLVALSAWAAATVLTVPAAADYEGASGYGVSTTTYELDVEHDGYPRGGEATGGQHETVGQAPDYVVIEVEEASTQAGEGETVIVVQEPEPVAATEEAPPPPRVVAIEQPAVRCSEGIWVDGYWTYGDGQYVWVDGHCVVERTNYVFVHPRWDYYANVWWFVPGYYRPCGVWVGFGYYRPYHWFPPYYHSYYRGYRGVPVHRGVPRRPTVARPASRPTVRGVVPTRRTPSVGRQAPQSYGRTATVNRVPSRTNTVNRASTRAPTVNRAPTRAPTVGRVPTTRAPTVSRTQPTRAPTVGRVPTTRAPTVSRVPTTRAPTVSRVAPTRAGAVTRVPPTRAPAVGRAEAGPRLIGTVPRARPGIVSQPRTNASRTTSVSRKPSIGASGNRPRLGGYGGRPSPSRTGTVRRPSFGALLRLRAVRPVRNEPKAQLWPHRRLC